MYTSIRSDERADPMRCSRVTTSIINMFLPCLSIVERRKRDVRGRREKSSSLNGPRLRGQATSISRVIPSGVGRDPKISNARVIEEPPQVECIKVLLLEDTTATSSAASFWLSFPPSLFLPRFLVSRRPFRPSFFPSFAIMIPTRSRLVIILMASCTRRPSEVQQKEHSRDPLREEARRKKRPPSASSGIIRKAWIRAN